MTTQLRRALLRALWMQHSNPSRTEPDVLEFHAWLKANRPDLLLQVRRGQDPYQPLKEDLDGLFKRSGVPA